MRGSQRTLVISFESVIGAPLKKKEVGENKRECILVRKPRGGRVLLFPCAKLPRSRERPTPRAVEATNVVMTSKRTRPPSSSTPATRFSLSLSSSDLGNHSCLHNPLRRSSHRSLARSRTRGVSTSSSTMTRTTMTTTTRVFPSFFRFGNTSSSDLACRYDEKVGGGEGRVRFKLRYCTRRSYLQRISLCMSYVGYEVARYNYGSSIHVYRYISTKWNNQRF